MSKAVASGESSPATILKSGSNDSTSKKFRESPKPPDQPPPNVKHQKRKGELYNDQKVLLDAARSVHRTREQACSSPFLKKVEPFFAPVTAEDLLFLKSVLRSAEEFNQSQSQDVYKHDCSSEGEYNSLKQDFAQSFEDLGMGKISSEAPSLFQRILSAIIVEDERDDFYSPDEGINMPVLSGSSDLADSNFKDREGVESKRDLQSQMCFMPEKFSSVGCSSSNINEKERMSSFFSSNDNLRSDDAVLSSDKGFLNVPPQVDRVLQDLLSIGLCSKTTLHSEPEARVDQEIKKFEELQHQQLHLEGEESIGQEIKKLKELQRQQAAKVKNYLEKIDEAIQSAQDLEKRSTEEFALDHLTVMAYRRTVGDKRRVRSEHQKQANLSLIQRTLARCKEFEDTGKTCFEEPNLQHILFSPPPPPSRKQHANSVKGKNLTIGSARKRRSKVDAGGSVGRQPTTSHGMFPPESSSLQQTIPHSPRKKNVKRKPSLRRVVKKDMEPEPKQKRRKLIRSAAAPADEEGLLDNNPKTDHNFVRESKI